MFLWFGGIFVFLRPFHIVFFYSNIAFMSLFNALQVQMKEQAEKL